MGTLHLIPVGLSDRSPSFWLPAQVQETAAALDIYIAENAKTARAFLKQAGVQRPLREITIHTLSDKDDTARLRSWLSPLREGRDIGLVSEAGCPAVADPGARVVALAHQMGARVAPWTGPSSIMLGLMASGLQGQRFAFHGYAPVPPEGRARKLREWENRSRQQDETQILIETPYRNQAMFQALCQELAPGTELCVARSLTAEDEWIRTRSIEQWRKAAEPDLHRKPAIFLFLAR